MHQVHPHIVVRPGFDRRVHEGVGEGSVGAQTIANTLFFQLVHGPSAHLAFGFARAEDEDAFAARAHDVADEGVGRLDFQAFGAPAKLGARRGVTFADEVDPEGVVDFGGESMRDDGHTERIGGVAHRFERLGDPRGDDGIFDERIGADDVDGFGAFVRGQTCEGEPDELQGGGRIFSAAVADDPGNGVTAVEIADFVEQRVDRALEAEGVEDGIVHVPCAPNAVGERNRMRALARNFLASKVWPGKNVKCDSAEQSYQSAELVYGLAEPSAMTNFPRFAGVGV